MAGVTVSITFNPDIYKALDALVLQRLNEGDKHMNRSRLVNELLRNNQQVQKAIVQAKIPQ
ncbi:MAG: hypothetical protein WC365_04285 [Candidatus Babeliales bacterium]|jgi:hypothetical protein